MTEVVAALIWKDDRFLACQRPAHKARGLLWEFVGGKVEPGETHAEALIRECREELDVTVSPGDVFMEVVHAYPDLTVRLTLFHATIASGTLKALEHADLRWITVEEIKTLEFCPADEEILTQLRLRYGKKTALQEELAAMADASYQAFQAKLIPAVPTERILGVRMPALRTFAKAFSARSEAPAFLSQLPHRYLEENNLHGLLLGMMKDHHQMLEALTAFLPYVDNWATCDLLRPVVSDRQSFLLAIRRWLSDAQPYTRRFAMEMLMVHYLKDGFEPAHLDWVSCAVTDHYYVRMMAAWYYATALAYRFETVRLWLAKQKLPVWTHNKSIQKAIESYRISAEQKAVLRSMKRK